MRFFRVTAASGCLLASLLTGPAHAQVEEREDSRQSASVSAPDVPENLLANWELLDRYCIDCHNITEWAGGIAFDVLGPDGVASDLQTWEMVVRKLRGRLMPPPGNDLPTQSELEAFVFAMEGHLDHVATRAPNPGYVQAHRMNRSQYVRSVEDLLGLTWDPGALFPRDGEVAGFDNIANGLTVSPTLMDDLLVAAREISILAVGLEAAESVSEYPSPPGVDQTLYVPGMPPGTRGGMSVRHHFPVDGEYLLSIQGLAKGGYNVELDYPHTVVVILDGKRVFEGQLGGEADQRAVDQIQPASIHAINERFEDIPISVAAGPREVGVSFIATTLAAPDGPLYSFVPDSGMNRVPAVDGLRIVGPVEQAGVGSTPSRERIFVCYPETPAEEAACADRIIASLASRAYRGDVSEVDLELLRAFYRRGQESSGFDAGVQQVVMAILASPKFLYRLSLGPGEYADNGSYYINELELASRLSFFLWNRIPDEELLDLVARGELRRPDVLEAQVLRMLQDPRAGSLVTDFAFQWLDVSRMDEVEPDGDLFPEFDRTLREAFRTELELFIASVFEADRPVTDLITAGHTFLNERLARHYGIPDVWGAHFRRVELDQTYRWGLLGKGGILLANSFPNRTSPVTRGDWILKKILGTPPAPPPPEVEAELTVSPDAAPMTVREQLEIHREVQSCNACHGVIDPPGLALENFDVTGQWRELDRYARVLIDAHGALPDGTQLNGPDDLRYALMRQPGQLAQAFTEKLLMYAVGRELSYYDMPAVRAITRAAADDDYRFSSIVLGVVNSAPFQMRRAQEPGPAATPSATDPVQARAHE